MALERLGFTWWAAGPWWGTVSLYELITARYELTLKQYYQSMEPPNGAAIAQVLPQALKPFL